MSAADDALRERLLAERDERRRIAELVHDGPVQHVAALTQMLGAAVDALAAGDDATARTATERSLAVAREAAVELREIVAGLEPATLHDEGLPAALRELAERTLVRRGAAVTLELDDAPVLGEGAASGLYQVARESLDQAVRRGPPRTVRVVLAATPAGGAVLRIEDDAAPERRQTVLDALAERAAELNGTLTADRADGRTTIAIEIPPSAAAL